MGRYMKKCKGLEEAAETAVAAAAGRKRKVGLEESELSTTSSVQLKTRRLDVVVTPENSENSTCESINSDQVGASCCSSNGSSELATKNSKFLDLKEEENEVSAEFFPTTAGDSVDSRDRREKMPLSEIQAESDELESTLRPKHGSNSRHTLKMPSEAELEEFFAAAEKNMQKQFTEKYNYDIVKDEPLEGRYEWVQI
ncbi:hypothetical protein ACJIZ3_014878 [Penstemon smallii]|uniref:Cyclin-dependent kinase inhibitor n=1 Tax=Penstemon smallii TaxID=265156 RepID=A0ABD3RL36_9LAMI